jgi:hypothetical protein
MFVAIHDHPGETWESLERVFDAAIGLISSPAAARSASTTVGYERSSMRLSTTAVDRSPVHLPV